MLFAGAAFAFCMAIGFAVGIWYFPEPDSSRPAAFLTSFPFQAGYVAKDTLRSGWAKPEEKGVWSIEPVAELALELDDKSTNDLAIEFAFFASVPKDLNNRIIDVTVNGGYVGRVEVFQQRSETVRRVIVPRAIWKRARPAIVSLSFDSSDRAEEETPQRGILLRTVSMFKVY